MEAFGHEENDLPPSYAEVNHSWNSEATLNRTPIRRYSGGDGDPVSRGDAALSERAGSCVADVSLMSASPVAASESTLRPQSSVPELQSMINQDHDPGYRSMTNNASSVCSQGGIRHSGIGNHGGGPLGLDIGPAGVTPSTSANEGVHEQPCQNTNRGPNPQVYGPAGYGTGPQAFRAVPNPDPQRRTHSNQYLQWVMLRWWLTLVSLV